MGFWAGCFPDLYHVQEKFYESLYTIEKLWYDIEAMDTYYNDYSYSGSDSPGPGPGPSPGPGPGSPGPRPPRKDDSWDVISWVIDVILLLTAGPVGLLLTVAHAMGYDIIGNLLSRLFGRRGSGKTGSDSTAARAKAKAKEAWTQVRSKKAESDAAKQKATGKSVHRADAGAVAKTVFGWILTGFGLFGILGSTLSGDGFWTIFSMIAVALGGGALVLSAAASRRKEAKFHRCMTVSGTRGVVDIRKVSETLGLNLKDTVKLLDEMVDRGYYGEKAYIDQRRCLLVINVEDMRDVYRKEDEEKQAEEKEKLSEYERYVERIRKADEEIEDENMSEKIRRMQSLTASIFAEVEAHPEKRSMIDRFMTYYLPTTLKLLESYARIESQGVSGENMAKAKKDIEGIADTLVAGYEKQLDRLYRAEAVDIAADVSVIENMLKRDGLADNEFSQTSKE